MDENIRFDERSDKWISIFQKYTQVAFWVEIVASAVLCICGWTDLIWITGSPFLDGLILLGGGIVIAYSNLVINMLMVQFLNIVQLIRKKLIGDEHNGDSMVENNSSNYVCPNCGKTVVYGDVQCSCGQAFDWNNR